VCQPSASQGVAEHLAPPVCSEHNKKEQSYLNSRQPRKALRPGAGAAKLGDVKVCSTRPHSRAYSRLQLPAVMVARRLVLLWVVPHTVLYNGYSRVPAHLFYEAPQQLSLVFLELLVGGAAAAEAPPGSKGLSHVGMKDLHQANRGEGVEGGCVIRWDWCKNKSRRQMKHCHMPWQTLIE